MGSSVSVGCGLIKFIAEGLSSALSGILSPHRTNLDILHTVATDVCGRWQIGFFNSDINIVMNAKWAPTKKIYRHTLHIESLRGSSQMTSAFFGVSDTPWCLCQHIISF